MKIIYSVCPLSNEHLIRSEIICSALLKAGHNIHYTRGPKSFEPIIQNNELNLVESLKFPQVSYNELPYWIKQGNFDWCITDMEPIVPMLFNNVKRTICIDPMHSALFVDNLQTPSNGKVEYFRLLNSIQAQYNLIPTFIPAPQKDFLNDWACENMTNRLLKDELFNPILRDSITKQIPSYGEHILVYQTSNSAMSWLPSLLRSMYPHTLFKFYGFGSLLRAEEFECDLANCKFVITNGGHGVISEALHLRKPIITMPIINHYEQQLNASYVEHLGYGINTSKENLIVNIARMFDQHELFVEQIWKNKPCCSSGLLHLMARLENILQPTLVTV